MMKITIEEIRSSKILALSWKEPYGSLMLHGKIETRTWKTIYKGLVLICCSKTYYDCEKVMSISREQYSRLINKFDLSYKMTDNIGKAIAIGRLVDCRPMTSEDENKTFVKYYPDLYCHVYEDVTPIEPFPWKGKQGWTEVSQEIKNKIILK